jgi:VanZ family protein
VPAAEPPTTGQSATTTEASPRRALARRWWRPALVGLALVVAALLPGGAGGPPTAGPLGLVGADKWLHAVGYALFAAVLVPALDPDRPARWAVLVAVVAATALGAGLELAQWPVPGRSTSAADAAANAVGALVGAVASVAVSRARRPGD